MKIVANTLEILVNRGYINFTEKEVKSALEKQIPKKVNISLKGTTGWNTKCHCPNCRAFISNGKHCCECGQALDWSDTE